MLTLYTAVGILRFEDCLKNHKTPIVLGGELRETQTANYFSNFSPVDCAVPSANA